MSQNRQKTLIFERFGDQYPLDLNIWDPFWTPRVEILRQVLIKMGSKVIISLLLSCLRAVMGVLEMLKFNCFFTIFDEIC